MPVGPFYLCDDPGIAVPLKAFSANPNPIAFGLAVTEDIVEGALWSPDNDGARHILPSVRPTHNLTCRAIRDHIARRPRGAGVSATEQTSENGSAFVV